MGRWKGSPQGPYWDANDTGPNQVDPPPGMSPGGPQQQPGGYLPPMDFPITPRGPDANPGGISGQFPGGFPSGGGRDSTGMPITKELRPWDVDMSGDPPPGYHWEWSGGVTGGKHPVPDGQHDPQIPGQGGPMGPPMDTSGWPRKQYPGGVGGPIPPWMTGGEGGVPGQGPYGGEWTPTNQRPLPPWAQGDPNGPLPTGNTDRSGWGKMPPIPGDFAPGGAAWTGGNMQPGEVWNNGQATDQYTKESAPLGYFYPGSKYGDKDEYYKLHGGGGMSTGGSLSSLVGKDLGSSKKANWLEQGFASGNLNSGQWGTLSGLAGFKK